MSNTHKINCLIIDDEVPALNILNEYAGKIPFLNVVALCDNAFEAMDKITKGNIDFIFLDIQMPGLSGLDLIKTMKNPPYVVLTTAYSQYAIEGYDLDVVDYLLKPVPFERFLKAVNKVVERLNFRHGEEQKLNKNDHSIAQTKDYFFVKVNYKLVKVFYDDILFIEGLSEYVKIHTVDSNLVVLESLKNLESTLPAGKFLRIHKSYIVATSKIDSVFGNTVEIDGKMLPVGKSYKETVMNKLLT